MKLIDVLVKHGKWPEGATQFHRHGPFEYEAYFYGKGGGQFGDAVRIPTLTGYYGDASGETITREQYEAALAASQHPAGDGTALPPVGCICEALAPSRQGGPWTWQRVKVVESGIAGAEKERLVYNIETTRPSWVDEFRPIRTEAERKSEEVADSLNKLLGDIEKYPTWKDALSGIYDLVAAGEVPHFKLEASDE